MTIKVNRQSFLSVLDKFEQMQNKNCHLFKLIYSKNSINLLHSNFVTLCETIECEGVDNEFECCISYDNIRKCFLYSVSEWITIKNNPKSLTFSSDDNIKLTVQKANDEIGLFKADFENNVLTITGQELSRVFSFYNILLNSEQFVLDHVVFISNETDTLPIIASNGYVCGYIELKTLQQHKNATFGIHKSVLRLLQSYRNHDIIAMSIKNGLVTIYGNGFYIVTQDGMAGGKYPYQQIKALLVNEPDLSAFMFFDKLPPLDGKIKIFSDGNSIHFQLDEETLSYHSQFPYDGVVNLNVYAKSLRQIPLEQIGYLGQTERVLYLMFESSRYTVTRVA